MRDDSSSLVSLQRTGPTSSPALRSSLLSSRAGLLYNIVMPFPPPPTPGTSSASDAPLALLLASSFSPIPISHPGEQALMVRSDRLPFVCAIEPGWNIRPSQHHRQGSGKLKESGAGFPPSREHASKNRGSVEASWRGPTKSRGRYY